MNPRRRSLGILFLSMAAAVFIAACGGPAKAPSDLARFDEIELGSIQGSEVQAGVTRSHLLPVVVTRSGRGDTSLAIVDAHAGAVTDAGPIPVEGWVANVYPRASDRYVAMLVNVCAGKPYEGDGGDECGGDEAMPVGVQLSVYDITKDTWETLPIDAASNQDVALADVDGSTATLKQFSSRLDEPDLWATVDLGNKLKVGPFTATKPAVRPNGFASSGGHIDGFGWKARGTEGVDADTTWVGDINGTPKTIAISNTGTRHMHGAGRCLLIGTFRARHLNHLHRLCTS